MQMCCRDGADDSLTFAFRFTDATISVPNEGGYGYYYLQNINCFFLKLTDHVESVSAMIL